MGTIGIRDGKLTAKKISIQDKLQVVYDIVYTATVSTGGIAGGLDLNAATVTKVAKDFLVQPPYPLNIGVTTNTSPALTTDRVRVTGYDSTGILRYEDVKIASTVSSTYYTNYSYGKITGILPVTSGGVVGTVVTDDIGIGWGNKAGLPYPIATSDDLVGYIVASSHATTGPTVTAAYNQVTVSGADSLSAMVRIVYLTKVQD